MINKNYFLATTIALSILSISAMQDQNAHLQELKTAAFFENIAKGNTYLVEDALNSGADIEAIDLNSEMRPLELAIYKGHLNTALLLINYGADVNTTDSLYRETPLMIIAGGSDETISSMSDSDKKILIDALLDKGANINAVHEENGYTALDFTKMSNKKELQNYLSEKGATGFINW